MASFYRICTRPRVPSSMILANRRKLKTSMIEHQGRYFCNETALDNLRLSNYMGGAR
jgi:hypothetical protein